MFKTEILQGALQTFEKPMPHDEASAKEWGHAFGHHLANHVHGHPGVHLLEGSILGLLTVALAPFVAPALASIMAFAAVASFTTGAYHSMEHDAHNSEENKSL